MNAAQIDLIERSLRVIGWLSLVIGALMLIIGFTNNLRIDDVFDTDEAAYVVWPPFIIGGVALWMRAYLRAGRHST
ncbi:hypothetical protein [Pseudomonas monsensis]|uniref:hypothetical protein n=1 Tax=Pseudomonas monsensis TaxID=2745509 RepID=UPI00300F5CA3